ncbi:MAG TPA: hypothetical protein VIO16_01425 [Dehalococcoidia bacterium]
MPWRIFGELAFPILSDAFSDSRQGSQRQCRWRPAEVDEARQLISRKPGSLGESAQGVRFRLRAQPPSSDRHPTLADSLADRGVVIELVQRCRGTDVPLHELSPIQ